jgi:hypothetical protein
LVGLLLVRSGRLGVVPETDVYVWQRHWPAGLTQAVRAGSRVFRRWHVLAAEISAGNQVFRTEADWAELLAAGREVVPVVRIEGRIDAGRAELLVGLIRAEMASLPEGVRGALEIDHDSATARLADYAGFLRRVRAVVPVGNMAVTVLPTWLHAADFAAVAAAADVLILQVHAIGDPRLGVFDAGRAARWVELMGLRSSRPFLVSLPAYGARVVTGADGRLLAVSAESPALDGSEGMEVAASPVDVAGFIEGVRLDPPEGLRGFVWFRLPTGEDRRAWRMGTLLAVIRGEALHASVKIVLRAGDLAGLQDVLLENDGDIDGALPQGVTLPAGCAQADGVGAYRLDGAALRLRGGDGTIGPHSAMIAGWMRCAKDDGNHAP